MESEAKMVERIFLNSENVAEISCPYCQRVWKKNFSELIGHQRKIVFNCKCSCGNSFPAFLERRRYPRKDTDLGGAFIHDKKKSRGIIRVKNISLGGVGFQLTGDYVISTGDLVLLRFNLDDPFNTLISKEAFVRKIREKYIGSEFLGAIWKHDLLHLYLTEK
jgi:hypothetical protein